jgi:hypothetical protein
MSSCSFTARVRINRRLTELECEVAEVKWGLRMDSYHAWVAVSQLHIASLPPDSSEKVSSSQASHNKSARQYARLASRAQDEALNRVLKSLRDVNIQVAGLRACVNILYPNLPSAG